MHFVYTREDLSNANSVSLSFHHFVFGFGGKYTILMQASRQSRCVILYRRRKSVKSS